MQTVLLDLRFALRQLLKNPGFTAVAVLTLALGIGATSAVFNLIEGVLLTSHPYAKPQQVILISPTKIDGEPYRQGWATAQWAEWQIEAKSFDALAGYNWTFNFLIMSDGSESVEGMYITSDYFKVIGIKPLLGREFLQSETSKDAVIILGYDLWQRRFNGDPNILGQTVRITRHESPLTIVGVMPPGMRFLPSPTYAHSPNYDVNARVDYWLPATVKEAKPKQTTWSVVGRLRDGATLAQARAELTTIALRQGQADHDFEGITAKAQLLTVELNRDGRRLLLPLLGAVMLVFLIACGNVGGLLLARGLQRQQEYAVRCALGAQRMQLFRQVFTESLLLALVGGVLGACLATGTVKILKVIGGSGIPRLDAVTVTWPVLAFSLAAAIVAATVAGIIPALRACHLDPARGIKGASSSAGRKERRLLGGLAILQTSLTLALLVGAGLLIRTVNNLANVRPGYETDNILTMNVTSPMNWDKFNAPALERVSALPTVKHAAFVWGLPLTGNNWITTVEIEAQPDTSTGKPKELRLPGRAVTPEYFQALRMPMVAGRGFYSTDNRDIWKGSNAVLPAIINQAMADRYYPKENALGKKLRFAFENVRADAEIVGIVANARTEALTQEAGAELYLSYWQLPAFSKHLVIRTASDPRPLFAAVQRELRAIEPTVAIENVKTLQQIRSDAVAPQTFALRLLAGFSFAACSLALIGIYSVLSLSVNSRRREIAIRTAVGAQRGNILRLVLGEGFRLIVIGLVLGIGVAMVLSRFLRTFLFGVGPTDPATLVGMTLLFTAAGLIACWIPARRATKVDPMEALRYE